MKDFNKKEIANIIITEIKRLQKGKYNQVQFVHLGEALKDKIDFREYGYKKLLHFLREFSDVLEITDKREDNKPVVYYINIKAIQKNIESESLKVINKQENNIENVSYSCIAPHETMNGKVVFIKKDERMGFVGKIMTENGIQYPFNARNWRRKGITIDDIPPQTDVIFELKPPNKNGNVFLKNIRLKKEINIKHSYGEFEDFVYLKTSLLVAVLSGFGYEFENHDFGAMNSLISKITTVYNDLKNDDFLFSIDDGQETLRFSSGFYDKDGEMIYLYCTKNDEYGKQEWYCDRVWCRNTVIGGSIFNLINANWYEILLDLKKLLPSEFSDEAKTVVKRIEERCVIDASSLIWLKDGFLSAKHEANRLYVPTSYILPTEQELYLCCSWRKGIKGYGWYYDCITYENAPLNVYDKKDWLELWAVFDYESCCSNIEKQTLEERWSFGDRNDYGILRNYLNYTFAHQWGEDEVRYSADGKYAAFNTGLPDRNTYKYIYALYEKIESSVEIETHPLHFDSQYKFKSFIVSDRGGDGKLLSSKIHPLPKPPQYFVARSSTVWEFDFNDSNQLAIPGFDDVHILIQKCDRLPLEFYRQGAYASAELKSILESNFDNTQKYKEIREYFKPILNAEQAPKKSVSDAYHALHASLRTVIIDAITKLTWNWRAVVPCYNPEREELSFLLPVSFCDYNKPDRAMIATAEEEDGKSIYRIHTVVPLEWAYLDARLVCRPESQWLAADSIE